jgi:hypothetical protein
MKRHKIKLSFCVAYDWDYLQYSLPLVYKEADEICLAIDKDRISWAGNKFQFDEQGFQLLIEKIDLDKKIKLYEDDFHIPNLSPMENEIRQRSLMAKFLGSDDGWHLQLDSDEYFINFKGFVHYLHGLNPNRPINVCCPWITLYKRIDEGFLMVNPRSFKQIEFIPIATNLPQYEHGRRNGHFNHYTDFAILHQSWARTAEEIRLKLDNWGHKTDFKVDEYFKTWDMLNASNYKEVVNFHPFKPREWEALDFLKAISIDALIQQYKEEDFFKITKLELVLKNSIWLSRFRKYLLSQ